MAVAEPLSNIYEDPDDTNSPPEPTIVRRAASYSDFYRVVRAELNKDGKDRRKKKSAQRNRTRDALMLDDEALDEHDQAVDDLALFDAFDDHILEASQQEYL